MSVVRKVIDVVADYSREEREEECDWVALLWREGLSKGPFACSLPLRFVVPSVCFPCFVYFLSDPLVTVQGKEEANGANDFG